MPNGLNCVFFTSLSKQSDNSSFYVKPPPDAQPGDVFEVMLFGKKIKIRCPQHLRATNTSKRGPKFRILCCPDRKKRFCRETILMFRFKGCFNSTCVACSMGAGVHPIKDSNPPEFFVTIPDGTKPNQKFLIDTQDHSEKSWKKSLTKVYWYLCS